ncbi:hypothetical protein EP47_03185 [Legionella norrlandica]|uniref:Uncharacterized protein n=1 Tax=Legionella norrlandica TaxID=1498499 RepID=A0A0A2SR78_9GAMM|nr:hypothetical protein [Legionella norrlandica]KGP63640.1 hypothetical protein EP47_03185 [Legionella norrlandica]
MDFYHHKESSENFTYRSSPIKSLFDKYIEFKLFNKSKQIRALSRNLSKQKYNLFRNIHFSRLLTAYELLKKFKPNVIIIGEDGIAADFILISAAKKLHIPVIVLPYGLADSSYLISKGVEEKYKAGELLTTNDPSVQLVKKLYPKWVKETPYGEAIYLPPEFILALESLKIKIPYPWCLQGGIADIILLESDVMYQRYLSEGIKNEKMKLTGSIYCDVMNDVIVNDNAIKQAFEQFQRIDNHQLKILVCVPPSDHDGWKDKCDYQSVADFIVALLNLFNQYSNVEVVYSFHPRMKESDRKEILSLGIKDQPNFPLYEIPKCDILLACGSSLARWALAARKVVINFDLYKFGTNDFPHVPAHIQINEIEELNALIQLFSKNPNRFKELLLNSKNELNKMGTINGQATSSIFNAIKEQIYHSKNVKILHRSLS